MEGMGSLGGGGGATMRVGLLVALLLFAAFAGALPLSYEEWRGKELVTPVRSALQADWSTTCISEAPLPSDAADYLGCVHARDLSQVNIAANIAKLVSSQTAPDSVGQIVESVVTPLQEIVDVIIRATEKVPNYDDNICFGNWVAEEMDLNGCDMIPLNPDSEYTVLSMMMTMPLPGICTDSGEANFCIAVSLCPETYLPTVAVNVGATTLSCIAEKLAMFDMGISTVVTKAARLVLDSVGFGVSLSQQFEIPLYIYTGLNSWDNKLVTYNLHGMYYDQVVLEIKPSKWFGKNLPDFVAFGGRSIRAMAISGIDNDTIDSVFSSYSASYDDAGNLVSDVGESFLALATQVSIQVGITIDLNMQFKFSELGNGIGAILPDTELIEIARANALLQTTSTTQEVNNGNEITIRPGLYGFAGMGALANVVGGLVRWLLSFVQSIINLGGNWLPFDLVELDFISKILNSVSGGNANNDFGFGFAVTDEGVGIFLNVPLLFAEVGYFRVECRFSYSGGGLDCSVETGLNKNFFKAVAQLTKEGILWLARETDEAFQKLGRVIVAGLEDVTGAIGAWMEGNVRKTALMIRSGVLALEGDIRRELMNWARWGETFFGDIAEDIAEFLKDAIREISEWGKNAVRDAEKALRAAEKILNDLVRELSKAFGCGEESILKSITGCSNCCKGLNNAVKWLATAGRDVAKALEAAWNEITNFVNNAAKFFYSQRTSRSYRGYNPERYDLEYNCRVLQMFETRRTIIMGIVVSKKTVFVGTTVDSGCLSRRIQSTETLEEDYMIVKDAEKRYNAVHDAHRDAMFGSNLSAQDLLAAGFRCDKPEIWHMAAENGKIPITITCYSHPIAKEGRFSDTTVSSSITKAIDLSGLGEHIGEDIIDLQKQVAWDLARKITKNFAAPPSDCKNSPAPPSDGSDNNCDGVVDDQVCHFEDFTGAGSNVSERDCTCNAPRLAEAAPVVEALCSDDLSPSALGYPDVTTDDSNGCSAGMFFQVEDKLIKDDFNRMKKCGGAKYRRTFHYLDSRFQRSNIVTQTIKTLPVPPALDETMLEPVLYMACELPVGEHNQMAPEADVPFDLATSDCSDDLDEGYTDKTMDYVGCPSNPAVSGVSDKGWNVEREWFVEDGCGERAYYTQRIVRTDEKPPEYEFVPPYRAQSCRADLGPLNTGIAVATDNCDPSNIINADWSQPAGNQGGRMSYEDTVEEAAEEQVNSILGCAKNVTRTFTTTDRVCNSASVSHRIETFDFDFLPMHSMDGEESASTNYTTTYDPSSLIPSFSISFGEQYRGPSLYPHDQLVFVSDTMETVQVTNCTVGPSLLEYLDTNSDGGTGEWKRVPLNTYLFAFHLIQFNGRDSSVWLDFGYINADAESFLTELFASSADSQGRLLIKFKVRCEVQGSASQSVIGQTVAYLTQ